MAFQKAAFLTKNAVGRGRQLGPTRLTYLFSNKMEQETDPGVVVGTDLRIVKYPHPSLRAPNADVKEEELEDLSMSKLAKEMFLVM